jgi:hypothetical protein
VSSKMIINFQDQSVMVLDALKSPTKGFETLCKGSHSRSYHLIVE